MRTLPFIAMCPVLAYAAGCSAEFLSVEVVVDEICITDVEMVFVADDSGWATDSFLQDDLIVRPGEDFKAEVNLLAIEMKPADDVRGFHVSLASADPESELPAVTLIDFEHTGASNLFIEADSRINLVDYVSGSGFELSFDVQTEHTTDEYVLGGNVCFSMRGTYSEHL